MQARAAFGDVLDNLLPHAMLPEFLQVVNNAGDSFFSGLCRKIERDLVRVVNHVFGLHRLIGAALADNLRGQALGLLIVLLPYGEALGRAHLDGGHLVFGTAS